MTYNATSSMWENNDVLAIQGPHKRNGNDVTAIGIDALLNNTTGFSNNAFGKGALSANMVGSLNTAMGTNALLNNNGNHNTAFGANCLEGTTIGNQNTAIGSGVLIGNTTGIRNTAVGFQALDRSITGSNNIAIGANAGDATDGDQNIVIGHMGVTGESNTIRIGTDGDHNDTHLVGNVHLSKIQLSNHASNPPALNQVLTSLDATGQLGWTTLSINELSNVDINSTLRDRHVLQYNASRSVWENTLNGSVRRGQVPKDTNVGLGPATLDNATGGFNSAIGNLALSNNTTGQNNVGVGNFSLSNNTTGGNNVGVGSQSVVSNTTGQNNVGLGGSTLRLNISGNDNFAGGSEAINSNVDGNNNIGVGKRSLFTNISGSNNIALGVFGGQFIDGDHNICIGHVGVSGESNVIRLGNAVHTDTHLAGNVHLTKIALPAAPVVGQFLTATDTAGTLEWSNTMTINDPSGISSSLNIDPSASSIQNSNSANGNSSTVNIRSDLIRLSHDTATAVQQTAIDITQENLLLRVGHPIVPNALLRLNSSQVLSAAGGSSVKVVDNFVETLSDNQIINRTTNLDTYSQISNHKTYGSSADALAKSNQVLVEVTQNNGYLVSCNDPSVIINGIPSQGAVLSITPTSCTMGAKATDGSFMFISFDKSVDAGIVKAPSVIIESTICSITNLTNLFDLNCGGTANFTGTFNNTSDDRLKDNEIEITDAISTIEKLTPVTYDRNDIHIKESGLIAQEIWHNAPELRHIVKVPENVSPDASQTIDISTNPDYEALGWGTPSESTDYAGINYLQMIPFLVKSVQELSAANKALTERVNQLESR